MQIVAEFTRAEYIAWLKEEERTLLDDTKYEPCQQVFDDAPIEEFIARQAGAYGHVLVKDNLPYLDIGGYEDPILVRLPDWTLPLVRKYLETEQGPHISIAVQEAEQLSAELVADDEQEDGPRWKRLGEPNPNLSRWEDPNEDEE